MKMKTVAIGCVFAVMCAFAARALAGGVPRTLREAESRVKVLRVEIGHADELYFKQSAPEITDAAYDELKRELAAIEEAFPELESANAAAGIGDDRTGEFVSARHRERMTSLKKSYSEAELRAFHAQVARLLGRDDFTCVIEPKFDGLAISVTFEYGRLVRAITRGNGREGDDVTENVRAIANLPPELRAVGSAPIPKLVELRGEIFVGLPTFRKLNTERESEGEEPFAHPRNLAAGTLKQHDLELIKSRGLEIVFYGIGACEPESARPASQQALHAAIRAWGLPGVENLRIARSFEEVWSAVMALGRDRAKYPFPTDGAVVKVDEGSSQRKLGVGPDAPNWAMAFKFVPQRESTRVLAITLQIGRTGVLTPVAELAPVQIGGTTIARASLHNRDEIRRRDLLVGDFVWVEKAGEVIPAIVGVDRARRTADAVPFVFPERCPECGTKLVSVEDEAAVRCPNGACPAQLRRRVEYFAGKSGVGISGLGPATIEALVSAGVVKSVADLYRLRIEDLSVLRGNKGERLLEAIERSKHATLWRFVNGLGVPNVGPTGAKRLARRFGGLHELSQVRRADLFDADGKPMEGMTSNAAEAVLMFFSEAGNRELVEALLANGVQPGVGA